MSARPDARAGAADVDRVADGDQVDVPAGAARPDARAEAVARRYVDLLSRLERAGGSDISVVAVTKSFGPWAIDAAAGCGIAHIGENYAQECVAKLAGAASEPKPLVHFIGRLQRNKVRPLKGCVDVWQTVDRPELAREIGRWSPGAQVMVQVNIARAETQGGCAPAETEAMVSAAAAAGLRVSGLMAIGRHGTAEGACEDFRALRRLVDSLGLRHCSMGMTDDLEAAVAEGATMVRIGRGLFGERPRSRSGRVPQWNRPTGKTGWAHD